jgi:hypothetical protein
VISSTLLTLLVLPVLYTLFGTGKTPSAAAGEQVEPEQGPAALQPRSPAGID